MNSPSIGNKRAITWELLLKNHSVALMYIRVSFTHIRVSFTHIRMLFAYIHVYLLIIE